MTFASRRCMTGCVTVAAWLLLASLCEACPTCKDALADGQHNGLMRGYFWSILFMMSMPFTIFMGMATFFYLQVRKARVQSTSTVEVPTSVEA